MRQIRLIEAKALAYFQSKVGFRGSYVLQRQNPYPNSVLKSDSGEAMASRCGSPDQIPVLKLALGVAMASRGRYPWENLIEKSAKQGPPPHKPTLRAPYLVPPSGRGGGRAPTPRKDNKVSLQDDPPDVDTLSPKTITEAGQIKGRKESKT